jgi:basic amino acid/polyamine antiporter, APA family
VPNFAANAVWTPRAKIAKQRESIFPLPDPGDLCGYNFSVFMNSNSNDLQGRSTSPDLLRELGAAHAASIVIGVVIGSGIFLVPAEMMQAAGSARLVYLAWIVGGIFSFFGAVTYAELGAMKPQAGGEYVYIRDAYGPLPGFLCGWTWTVVVKPTSLAAISTGIVRILANLNQLSFLALRIGHSPVTWGQLVAIGFVLLVSAINYVGVRRAGNFQLAFTILKICLIVAIAALAFASRGDWMHFTARYAGGTGGIAGFMAALAAALWAYDGWSDLNMVAEEVRDPERNIPLALIGGLLVIGVLYMLVNAAVQFALPPTMVATSSSPMSDAVKASFLGAAAALMVSGAMVVSLTTTLNGVAMSGARMAFALARDRNFFSVLAKVHPRFHTPHVAIVIQAILSVSFLLIGGSFRQLFTLALFAEWLSYMTASSALFVFRSKGFPLQRAFRIWGYPLAPALFILASAALLYYTFRSNLHYSALGSLVILAGVPVYYAFALRRKV